MEMSCGRIEIGIAVRTIPDGENAPCGDVAFISEVNGRPFVALIDGLGHGEKANEVAEQAREHLEAGNQDQPLDETMSELANRFRGSRGFVAALARIDAEAGLIEFCGIGNITARLFTNAEKRVLSGPGIVGQYSARPAAKELPFPIGARLLLHTDGISSNLRLDELMPVLDGPAQSAAQNMLTHFARPDDDAGVALVRRIK